MIEKILNVDFVMLNLELVINPNLIVLFGLGTQKLQYLKSPVSNILISLLVHKSKDLSELLYGTSFQQIFICNGIISIDEATKIWTGMLDVIPKIMPVVAEIHASD